MITSGAASPGFVLAVFLAAGLAVGTLGLCAFLMELGRTLRENERLAGRRRAEAEAQANALLDSFCPPVEDDPTDTDLQAVMRWFLLGPGHEVRRITLDQLIDAAGIPLDRQMPTHFEQARELLERLSWDEVPGHPIKPHAGRSASGGIWYRPPTSISPSQITDPLED